MVRTKKARSRLASSIALEPLHPHLEPTRPPLADGNLRLLDKREVCDLVGRSFQCLWLWMRAGKFPKALDLHGRPVWRASDIEQWIERLSQRRYKGDD